MFISLSEINKLKIEIKTLRDENHSLTETNFELSKEVSTMKEILDQRHTDFVKELISKNDNLELENIRMKNKLDITSTTLSAVLEQLKEVTDRLTFKTARLNYMNKSENITARDILG